MKAGEKIVNRTWIQYIVSRIKKNQNFMALVTGPPGSGKTYSCLSVAEDLDKELNNNFTGDMICMTPLEFLNQLGKDYPPGTIFILEELGVNASSRKWQSAYNQALNLVLQTFRYKGYIVLANVPYMDFIDSSIRKLVHAQFEMLGFDKKKEIGICKPFKLQYNGRMSKWYYKYLIKTVKTDDGYSKERVTRWELPLASQKIRDIYAKKEQEFKGNVLKDAQKTMRNMEEKEREKLNDKKSLTQRQEDVLQLLKDGKTVPDIAAESSVSMTAIYGIINSIKKKGYKINPVHFGVGETKKILKYEVS